MFKNYLTYSFAVRFQQSVTALDLPAHVRLRLTRSAEQMVELFSKSMTEKDPKREAGFLAASCMNLKDCRETLDQNGIHLRDVDDDYRTLLGRLERLTLQSAESEGGQLRLLG